MDYFKHYTSASDGNTLNQIEDKFGHNGYAYWFKLLELCALNWDGKSEPIFNFYETIVRKKLKISSTKLKLFLHFCSEVSALSFQVSGKTIQITHPNLREVKETRGRIYGNKNLKTDILRDKNKEEDKDIDKGLINLKPPQTSSEKITPDRIIQAFNDTLARKAGRIDFCAGLSGDQIRELANTLSFINFRKWETWEDLFQRVSVSPWLTGQEGSFVATLDWLINHTNALKVLSGKYPPRAEQAAKNRFEDMELN